MTNNQQPHDTTPHNDRHPWIGRRIRVTDGICEGLETEITDIGELDLGCGAEIVVSFVSLGVEVDATLNEVEGIGWVIE